VANPATVCIGSPTTLTASGANNYVWSNGISNGTSFIPSATNTYTVTGSDANGCTSTNSILVSIGAGLSINVSNSAPLLCIGDSSYLVASGATTYQWMPTTGLSSSILSNTWANPSTATTYTVVGSDANGCSGSTSVLVDVINGINLNVSKSNDIECGKSSAQLTATGATNYQWFPSALVNNPNINIVTTSINQTTTFYVTGTTGTCVETDSITVEFYNSDGGNLIVPSAFSPNNDGKNDCLKIISNANFKEFYFAIYNRWGERVFESANSEICWEGHYNAAEAPVGTYYYFIKAETSCGKIFKKGDITLLR
jgi:gliding motility-associated-like protein